MHFVKAKTFNPILQCQHREFVKGEEDIILLTSVNCPSGKEGKQNCSSGFNFLFNPPRFIDGQPPVV